MPESPTQIAPLPTSFPSMDFNALREEGINHIQQLSGAIWTDYNAHDPGVTLLETLTFALTDLGYRTDFSIPDLLAQAPNAPEAPKQFYPLSEIAVNCPVTVNDYRKILLDMPPEVGVRNAWLDPAEYSEAQLPLNGLYSVHVAFLPDALFGDLNDFSLSIPFEGPIPEALETAFGQLPEFEVEVAPSLFLPVETKLYFPTYNQVPAEFDELSESRLTGLTLNDLEIFPVENDFTTFFFVLTIPQTNNTPEISLTGRLHLLTNIPVHSSSEQLAFKTALLRQLHFFLQYYQAKRKAVKVRIDAILDTLRNHRNLCEDFKEVIPMDPQEIGMDLHLELTATADPEQVIGQVIAAMETYLSPQIRFYSLKDMLDKGKTTHEIYQGPLLENGFIDEDELKGLKRKNVLYTSDLIQVLLDIEGIFAVGKLELSGYVQGNLLGEQAKNCLQLVDSKKFIPVFSREKFELSLSREEVPVYIDFAAAEAEADRVLSLTFAGSRKGGARDLIPPVGKFRNLANYPSIQEDLPQTYGVGASGIQPPFTALRQGQARQLKAYLLFFEQILVSYLEQLAHLPHLFSIEPTTQQTYFNQPLHQVPQVAPVLGDEYEQVLPDLTEDTSTYEERRNRFLDHLIARFGESFSEYATYLFLKKEPDAPAQLIQQKEAYLQAFPTFSSCRGQGVNWHSLAPEELWESDIVSVLKQKVAHLVGLDNFSRKSVKRLFIENFKVFRGSTKWKVQFFNDEGELIMDTGEAFNAENRALIIADRLMEQGKDPESFNPNSISGSDRYKLLLGRYSFGEYESEAAALEGREELAAFFRAKDATFQFHFLECILLRPADENDQELYPVQGTYCPPSRSDRNAFRDPYSFRLKILFPDWSPMAKDPDFMRLFGKTIRMELPAIIYPEFHCLDEDEMTEFEEVYKRWLDDTGKREDLVQFLNNIPLCGPAANSGPARANKNSNQPRYAEVDPN